MTQTVTIMPQLWVFEVSTGQTILEAALNNNYRFPHRCTVGACAMCMCRKLEGEVSYHLEPMLTEKEIAHGWIFPCQAYAESDLLLTFESE